MPSLKNATLIFVDFLGYLKLALTSKSLKIGGLRRGRERSRMGESAMFLPRNQTVFLCI
jgi:hypothetical protein